MGIFRRTETHTLSPAQISTVEELYNNYVREHSHERSLLNYTNKDYADLLFNYGWALLQSAYKHDHEKARRIFKDMHLGIPADEQVRYCYALALHRTGDHIRAREMLQGLQGTQASSLRDEIERDIEREGLIGVGIVGSIIAVGASALAALLLAKRH